MRLTGILLTGLFTAISIFLAMSACDANGVTVNHPMMNVAALILVPAMISAISTALVWKA